MFIETIFQDFPNSPVHLGMRILSIVDKFPKLAGFARLPNFTCLICRYMRDEALICSNHLTNKLFINTLLY